VRGGPHALIGATTGGLVALATHQHLMVLDSLDLLPAIGAGVGAIAGLLPDIDHPGGEIHAVPRRVSKFARSLLPRRQRRLIPLLPRIPHIHLGEHRGPTHMLVAGAGVALFTFGLDLAVSPTLAWVFALVIFAAYATHLVADIPNYTPMRYFWWPLTIWWPQLAERPRWLPAVYLNSWRGRLVEWGGQAMCVLAIYLVLPDGVHQAARDVVRGIVSG
jgi:membrane-bound metal-dependent hydrolase YbcI (DUF457 family)